jgi:hypothetical protein
MSKKSISMGSKFAIATAQAEKEGYGSFKKGSSGAAKRKLIAEAIARKNTVVPGPAKKSKKK